MNVQQYPLIERALAVATKYPVFPCRDRIGPNGQTPKSPCTPHGFLDASQDPETIRRMFSHPEAALIGVPTGHGTGIFVVDIDPAGRKWAIENYAVRLPRTRGQFTRRGHHLIYAMPAANVGSTKGKVAKGVDIRANGGYVIWWKAEGLECRNPDMLAAVPEWLIEAAGVKADDAGDHPLANLNPPGPRLSADEIAARLAVLNPDMPYDGVEPSWLHTAMACHAAGGEAAYGAARQWSERSTHDKGNFDTHWRSFHDGGRRTITGAYLIRYSNEAGYRAPAVLDGLRMSRQGPIPDEENVGRILERDPELLGLARFDEFRCERVITRPVPLKGANLVGERGMPRPWKDADSVDLQKYIQRHYMPRLSRDRIEGPLDSHARRHGSFHPVREYLQGLEWDGKPRLETLLAEHFGADLQPREYLAHVGRKFLIAAVARILEPGCQVDSALVLEGPQGIGKSSALRLLAGDEWFSDSLPADLSHKDARDHLRGKWVVELPELAQFKRAEIETIKAYMSRRHESYRPSYGRHEVQFPRQCVFAGTTNASEYLVDVTGNRRFWIVVCGRIDLEALRRVRGQLWAEAAQRYRQREPWHLTGAVADVAAGEAQARVSHDPWTGDVVVALFGRTEPVTPGEVLNKMQLGAEQRNGRSSARVAQILRDLGWKRGPRHRHGQTFLPPSV